MKINNLIVKEVKGFPNYFISKRGGKVFTNKFPRQRGKFLDEFKELNTSINKEGYRRVGLRLNTGPRKKYPKKVSTLVAIAFIPNPHNYPIVNHKDGNKLNDNASNLEWCTQSYNVKHAYDNGLTPRPKGELNGRALLKAKQVLDIRESRDSVRNLSKAYRVAEVTIQKIRRREIWKHI